MNYTERLKALRTDKDINQKTIADYLNIAQTTYSDYENGNVRIPIDTLIKLAKYYDVDMNYISGISDKKAEYPK